jgi:hypothetical protein
VLGRTYANAWRYHPSPSAATLPRSCPNCGCPTATPPFACSLADRPTRPSLQPVLLLPVPRKLARPSAARGLHSCEPGRQGRLRSTVDAVTTVLLTAILLVAVMFVVVVASLALAARAFRRRRLDDARAQARHWVERLGGELLVLDAAVARSRAAGPAGLAEAAERFAAAGSELGVARSRPQCRIAEGTAAEGLHHVRIARRSLGLDPGPRVPGHGVASTLRAALADGTWSTPRLVDAVVADARDRARRRPAGTHEPVNRVGQRQQATCSEATPGR